jgi:DNA-binding transcriptional ArsR family regulator
MMLSHRQDRAHDRYAAKAAAARPTIDGAYRRTTGTRSEADLREKMLEDAKDILSASKDKKVKISQIVYAALTEPMTAVEIADAIQGDDGSVRSALYKLRRRGLVKEDRREATATRVPFVYWTRA